MADSTSFVKKESRLTFSDWTAIHAFMSKKGEKQRVRRFGLEKTVSSPDAKAEAAAFLAQVESRRRAFQPTRAELTPLKTRLVEQIEKAFAGVSCHHESRLLLGGEAEDDYVSKEAQAVLTRYEERDDWHAIPDDLLASCSFALCYVGPEAYRFLIPRFMLGALHGVVEVYFGEKPNSKFVSHMRERMLLLTPEQQQCLSDFLNLDCVDEEEQTCFGRNVFLPWELDEYDARFADEMSHREYGTMLVKRYFEKVFNLI